MMYLQTMVGCAVVKAVSSDASMSMTNIGVTGKPFSRYEFH